MTMFGAWLWLVAESFERFPNEIVRVALVDEKVVGVSPFFEERSENVALFCGHPRKRRGRVDVVPDGFLRRF